MVAMTLRSGEVFRGTHEVQFYEPHPDVITVKPDQYKSLK